MAQTKYFCNIRFSLFFFSLREGAYPRIDPTVNTRLGRTGTPKAYCKLAEPTCHCAEAGG